MQSVAKVIIVPNFMTTIKLYFYIIHLLAIFIKAINKLIALMMLFKNNYCQLLVLKGCSLARNPTHP
jgi:hypothetical protein